MRFTVVALTLGLVLAQAKDPMEQALQSFDATQRHALEMTGSFLQRQGINAPWMKDSQGHLRQLEAHEAASKVVIPAACKAKCPDTEAVMKALEKKMMAAMTPHASVIMKASTDMEKNGDKGATPAQLAEMIGAMEPMMKDILKVTFADMCTNRPAYVCLQTNADVCVKNDPNSMSLGVSLDDPMAMSKDYGPMLGCMCDKCQGAQAAFAQSSSKMMSVMMGAFMQLAAALQGGGKVDKDAAMDPKLEKDMLGALCPMLGMQRCFDANPTECGKMAEKSTVNMATVDKKITTKQDKAAQMAEAKATCKKAGVSTKGAAMAKVTTVLTIKGLSFSKVSTNAAVKLELTTRIKAQFLKKMSGYKAEDLEVTFSSGSVKATVVITPLPGSSTAGLKTRIATNKDELAAAVVADVKSIPAVADVLESGTTVDKLTATASPPSQSDAPSGGGAQTASGSYTTGVAGALGAVLAWATMSAPM